MTTLCFDFCSVTSNAHNHVHEHAHPHADSESDSERVDRLVIFLETHFGEVHIGVPEPEKGHEDGQDEGPEQALLIRLDEADAIVHLKSMVSYPVIGLLHFSFFFPLCLSLSFLGNGVEARRKFRPSATCIELLALMGVILLIAGISFLLDRNQRQ